MTSRDALFLAFDDGFFRYTRACLRSLVRHHPEHPDLLVLYDGNDPGILAFLRAVPRLKLVPPSALSLDLSGVDPSAAGHRLAYARFLCFTDALGDWDRILYLDGDTLVLGALNGLFEHEELFAVSNHYDDPAGRVFRPGAEDDPELQRRLAEDGLVFPGSAHDALNSGVLLVPRAWRRPGVLEELLALGARYRSWAQHADQGVLSLFFLRHGVRPSRDVQWNYQAHLFDDPEARLPLSAVRIFHFTYLKPDDPRYAATRYAGRHTRKLQRLYRRYAR